MTVTNRGGSRVEIQSNSGSRASTSTAEMDEVDSGLSILKIFDENASLASDSVFLEDSYKNVKSELELDALEFEAESWSCAVDPQYLKKQKKEVIKRQDVIYELMQTEMHHVRTLKIMLRVYSRALSEELQYGNKDLHQLFPCVDDLLELHVNFLARFKERRKESMEEGSDRNYLIQKIGDILLRQFSGDSGERMREKYGIFCSQHNKATSRYKDLFREKKFQNLMKKIGNFAIVRRLGVQECILLVTQRITKYPVLVERIIQNTEEGTEDYEALTQAIALIKETITDVDSRVHESEKVHRLREIVSKMELKSKLKNGLTLRKQDILRRHLLHDGVLYWKTASGRLKDILAVLLTDNLLLLQEKDQKYSLSPVDNKTPVISLQKLIVREVANEEKAMFLISASNTGAEMYEIHTNSKEERNLWMTFIRGAVESCPVQDTEILNEAEEENKLFTERAAKIKEFQERLNQKDCAIVQSLNEKLQTCIDMAELYGYEDLSQEPRVTLLPRADTGENLEGKGILQSAVTAAERIHYMLLSQTALLNPVDEASNSATALLRRSETFGGYDADGFKQKVKDRRAASISADSQMQDPTLIEPIVSTVDNNSPPVYHETEMIVCVETLLQHLYSLQVVISQQDSYVEVQKEREKQFRQQSSRGNMLLEQEKQRNFEKQREELVNVQKMQEQLRLERQRWERERDRQQKESEAMENMLRQRMGDSELQMRKLLQEREELEAQRREYQLDLERLRESQKAVEKDRERLELLKRLKVTSAGAGSFSSDLPVAHSATSNGEGMLSTEAPSIKPLAKTTMSMSAADYLERPEVTRRESSISDIRPALKKEVPIHLLSATNQIQKQVALTRQKIPTHLALDKVKEKPSRGKASHRSESTASLDHRLGFPSKLSGKEDGSVRSRRSASPNPLSSQLLFFQQDPVAQVEPSPETPLYTPVLYRQGSSHLLPPSFPPQPPPPPAEDEGSKEDVIFF